LETNDSFLTRNNNNPISLLMQGEYPIEIINFQ